MPAPIRNILFIMYDQLRYDYLSCAGHSHLQTPHMDRLATRGLRFTNAYVQSPVCGASRMSFYTGRYVQSHGASWNGIPLKVGEMTLGDYLRPLGLRTAQPKGRCDIVGNICRSIGQRLQSNQHPASKKRNIGHFCA